MIGFGSGKRSLHSMAMVRPFDTLNYEHAESADMKRLLVHGDPGIRKGAVIDHDGSELVCFQVTRNGDWHGPEEVQLWCVVGDASETGDFERRNYIPHFLDVETIAASDLEVIEPSGEIAP